MDIDNWDSYKKKDYFIKEVKKEKKVNIYNISNKNLQKIFSNYINFEKILKVNESNNSVIDLIKKYNKINLSKFKIINKKLYYPMSENCIFVILDSRSLKTNITALNPKKCILTLTNGLIFKKLGFRNRKYIKSEKISFLTLKNFLVKFDYFKRYKNIFLYIKGYKNNINGFIKFINDRIFKNNTNSKIKILNCYKKSYNNFFGFKKIKAIKRIIQIKRVKQ